VSLLAALSPEALAELEALIDSRVQAVLDLREREPAKRWLTARESGQYLGCSERAVYQRIRTGRIPADAVRHQGRRVLLDRLALDRAVEAES
jgi:excisionase family DNA binding protein